MLYIFLGWIFNFFHFKVDGFDILANFVGYILIFWGFKVLADRSQSYAKGKIWALVMAGIQFFLCIASIVRIDWGYISIPINVVTVVLSLYILRVCNLGVRDLEIGAGIYLGSDKLIRLWNIQAVLQGVCCVLACFSVAAFAYIILIIGFAAMVLNVIWLVMFYRARKAYEL